MRESLDINCPHCGEAFSIPLDPGGGRAQEFVYDCEVCCRPILVSVTIDPDGAVSCTARTDAGG